MVACTNHSVAVDNWAIRNLCRYCNSTIHLHIILMKKDFCTYQLRWKDCKQGYRYGLVDTCVVICDNAISYIHAQ